MAKAGKKKAPRSSAEFSTLDDFLKEEGKLEEFRTIATNGIVVWQTANARKVDKTSRQRAGG